MLQFSNVQKSFGARRVLRGLTFQIRPGEVYGLLGPNGAGKSTAFNILCGLARGDAGDVLLEGQPASRAPRVLLGVVPQQIALYQGLSVAENLAFFGALYGVRGRRLDQRVEACLLDIQLSERRASLVRDLSGGMQRRAHVAASLVHEPKLVLLDEPSVGLDVESREQLWALIRKLQARGTALLLTTHLLDEAEALCSRVGILQAGRLVAEGTPEALRARIPAVEIASVRSPDIERVASIATERGLVTRRFDHGLAIWLDRKLELGQVLELFQGVAIDSISRRPVTLQDAYLELSRSQED